MLIPLIPVPAANINFAFFHFSIYNSVNGSFIWLTIQYLAYSFIGARVATRDGWDRDESGSIETSGSLVSLQSEQDPADQLAALERSLSELSEITRFRQRRDYHITLQEELLDLYKSQEPSVPVKKPEYAIATLYVLRNGGMWVHFTSSRALLSHTFNKLI